MCAQVALCICYMVMASGEGRITEPVVTFSQEQNDLSAVVTYKYPPPPFPAPGHRWFW